jgi:hypothetical protein
MYEDGLNAAVTGRSVIDLTLLQGVPHDQAVVVVLFRQPNTFKDK